MSANQGGWVAEALLERLGCPIVDTQKMLAFALGDGRQIALQRDVDAARIWVEHEAQRGWPPATVIRKYEAGDGRHSNLPSRLSHRAAGRGGGKVIVLSVTGPRMLEAVLAWYGVVTDKESADRSGKSQRAASERAIHALEVSTASECSANATLAEDIHDADALKAEPSSLAPSNLTLGWLVESANASVRLRNCVSRSRLSSMTVDEALAAPDKLVEICTAVPAMGRKSIHELQLLLAHVFTSPSTEAEIHREELPAAIVKKSTKAEIRLELHRLLAEMPTGIVCRSRGGSVRLLNGIMGSHFENRPLGDIILEWRDNAPQLMGMRNFGRKSVSELSEICRSIVTDLFASAEFSGAEINEILLIIFDRGTSGASGADSILYRLQSLQPFGFSDLKSKEVTDVAGIVDVLLEALDERMRNVISRRLGLGGTGEETLEQTSESYSVTRERVRQIESKAIIKMRAAGEYLPLREALGERLEVFWPELAGQKGYVCSADIDDVVLPPDMKLAMKVADWGLHDVLDVYATRWRAGWHKYQIPNSELDALADSLRDRFDGLALPRPLTSDLPASSLMVLDLGLGMRTLRGYLLAPNSTKRSQARIIDLHGTFGTSLKPVEVLNLAQRFAGRVDDEVVSSRYLSMIMARQPHLFLEAAGDNWFALGLGNEQAPPSHDGKQRPLADEVTTRDGITMAGLLKAVLNETGPLRLSELIERASVVLADRRSAASIGPSLLMHKEAFERYLPGVYGLKGAAPTAEQLLHEAPAYLLNEEQARLFALGRRAGAAWHTFPLWTPAAEFALCGWAMEFGTEDILESLLSAASVPLWPVGPDEKAFWMERVASIDGRFHLHFEPREQIGYVLPRLDRLLAACLEARSAGDFNWVTANLVLNRTVGSHVAAGMMALMCSLGALTMDVGSHWQLPHRVGVDLESLVISLSHQLHDTGSLSWASEIGQAVLAKAAQSLAAPRGWLDRDLFAAMLDSAGAVDSEAGLIETDFRGQVIQATIDELLWEEEDFASPTTPDARNALEADYSAIKISSSRVVSDEEGDWFLGDLAID